MPFSEIRERAGDDVNLANLAWAPAQSASATPLIERAVDLAHGVVEPWSLALRR